MGMFEGVFEPIGPPGGWVPKVFLEAMAGEGKASRGSSRCAIPVRKCRETLLPALS
jgi:hypothetical protein